jgi:hypothetical protein
MRYVDRPSRVESSLHSMCVAQGQYSARKHSRSFDKQPPVHGVWLDHIQPQRQVVCIARLFQDDGTCGSSILAGWRAVPYGTGSGGQTGHSARKNHRDSHDSDASWRRHIPASTKRKGIPHDPTSMKIGARASDCAANTTLPPGCERRAHSRSGCPSIAPDLPVECLRPPRADSDERLFVRYETGDEGPRVRRAERPRIPEV